MEQALTTQVFDRDLIPPERLAIIDEAESHIQARTESTARGVIEMGKALTAAKEAMPHGMWASWLKVKFQWSADTAENMMKVSRKFPEIPNGSDFGPTALYILSAKSAPAEARLEAIKLAADGQRITKKVAKMLVERFAQAAQKVVEDALATNCVSIGIDNSKIINQQIIKNASPETAKKGDQIANHVAKQSEQDTRIVLLRNVSVISIDFQAPGHLILELTPQAIEDLMLFRDEHHQSPGLLTLSLVYTPEAVDELE